MTSISIIGAGWLGKSLAQHLKQRHAIYLSKSSPESTAALLAEGWNADTFTLGGTLPNLLANTELAVINIPPKLRGTASPQDAERFARNMLKLVGDFMGLPNITNSKKRLIFISTTAVYGNVNGEITETSAVAPITLSAKAHVEIEQHLHTQYPGQACVLRLAGLVSADRHPIRSLVKRAQASHKPLDNPSQVVNLIHRVDVIAAISAIIDKHHFGTTLHLACPDHPTRERYYNWAAEHCGLPALSFNTQAAHSTGATGKVINAAATLQQLDLTLQAPSPYDMFSVEG